MEIMSKFKVGDKIVRVNQDSPWAPIGYETTVLKNGKYKDSDSSCKTDIADDYWELVAPKWSIYNNDLPWEELSDKQKGKMLLAAHSGVKFFKFYNMTPTFSDYSHVYTAIKPEPVKPEPTMAELWVADWSEQDSFYKIDVAKHMIAKGWTKPCK
jgi:hypothetical protein